MRQLLRQPERHRRHRAGPRPAARADRRPCPPRPPPGTGAGPALAQTGAAARRERRDYGTLIEAVRGLDLVVTVAAASAWSRNDPLPDQTLPANVVKRRLDYRGLRDLYDRSEFVVVPLQDVDFQAGSLVMYEAMAMGKAVIATRTRAHRDGDIVRDGETGLLVPPGDPGALREAIVRLHTDPAAARRMGENARRVVEASLNHDTYVRRMLQIVRAVGDELGGPARATDPTAVPVRTGSR